MPKPPNPTGDLGAATRFQKVLADIRQRIERGALAPGEKLPTERRLADRYRCAQATVNKVVATLVAEGILIRTSPRTVVVAAVAPRQKKRLTVMSWIATEQIGSEVWDALRASFERRHPHVEVTALSIPFSIFQKRLVEMVGGGEAPDVVQIHNIWTSSLADVGALLPIDDKLSPALLTDHLTWKTNSNRYQGRTYSIDWALSPHLLFVNRVVLRRAGLDADRPPRTIDALIEMSDRIRACNLRENGEPVIGFANPTNENEATATFFLPIFHALGGALLGEQGDVTLASPTAVRAFATYRQLLLDSGCPFDLSAWDVRRLFAQNRVGFAIDGSMGRGFFRKQTGLGAAADANLTVVPVPKGSSGAPVTFCINHSLAITSQSTLKDEAVAFIEHLLSDRDLARRYYEEEGLIPARGSLFTLPEFRDSYAELVLEQAMSGMRVPTELPGFQTGLVFLTDAIRRILRDDVVIEQVIAEAARSVALVLRGSGRTGAAP